MLNALVPILIALALVAFFWGIFRYVWGAGGEDSKADGKKIMLAGLLGLFVMLSVWGIIRIAQSSLGISGTEEVTVPKIPKPSSNSSGVPQAYY